MTAGRAANNETQAPTSAWRSARPASLGEDRSKATVRGHRSGRRRCWRSCGEIHRQGAVRGDSQHRLAHALHPGPWAARSRQPCKQSAPCPYSTARRARHRGPAHRRHQAGDLARSSLQTRHIQAPSGAVPLGRLAGKVAALPPRLGATLIARKGLRTGASSAPQELSPVLAGALHAACTPGRVPLRLRLVWQSLSLSAMLAERAPSPPPAPQRKTRRSAAIVGRGRYADDFGDFEEDLGMVPDDWIKMGGPSTSSALINPNNDVFFPLATSGSAKAASGDSEYEDSVLPGAPKSESDESYSSAEDESYLPSSGEEGAPKKGAAAKKAKVSTPKAKSATTAAKGAAPKAKVAAPKSAKSPAVKAAGKRTPAAREREEDEPAAEAPPSPPPKSSVAKKAAPAKIKARTPAPIARSVPVARPAAARSTKAPKKAILSGDEEGSANEDYEPEGPSEASGASESEPASDEDDEYDAPAKKAPAARGKAKAAAAPTVRATKAASALKSTAKRPVPSTAARALPTAASSLAPPAKRAAIPPLMARSSPIVIPQGGAVRRVGLSKNFSPRGPISPVKIVHQKPPS